MSDRVCLWCGENINHRRTNVLFCKDIHRVHYHKIRRRLRTVAERLIGVAYDVTSIALGYPDRLTEALDHLDRIVQESRPRIADIERDIASLKETEA